MKFLKLLYNLLLYFPSAVKGFKLENFLLISKQS